MRKRSSARVAPLQRAAAVECGRVCVREWTFEGNGKFYPYLDRMYRRRRGSPLREPIYRKVYTERIARAIKQGGTARGFSCPGIQILNCGMGAFFFSAPDPYPRRIGKKQGRKATIWQTQRSLTRFIYPKMKFPDSGITSARI